MSSFTEIITCIITIWFIITLVLIQARAFCRIRASHTLRAVVVFFRFTSLTRAHCSTAVITSSTGLTRALTIIVLVGTRVAGYAIFYKEKNLYWESRFVFVSIIDFICAVPINLFLNVWFLLWHAVQNECNGKNVVIDRN